MCFRPAATSLNRCYKCGKVNKPTAAACVDCGARLELGKAPCPQCETFKEPLAVCPNCGFVPEVECPKCHTKNPVTNTQCSNCGYKAPQMPAASSAPTPGVAPKMPPPKAPPAPPKAPPPAPPRPPSEAPKVPPAPPKKPEE